MFLNQSIIPATILSSLLLFIILQSNFLPTQYTYDINSLHKHINISEDKILDDYASDDTANSDAVHISEQLRAASSWSSSTPQEFEPVGTGDTWNKAGYGMSRLNGDEDNMAGHPYLPSNVSVESARCRARDTNSTYNLRMKLMRTSRTNAEVCGTAYSSGSSGYQTINISSNSCEEDTENDPTASDYSMYFIEVYSPIEETAPGSTTLEINECAIEYK